VQQQTPSIAQLQAIAQPKAYTAQMPSNNFHTYNELGIICFRSSMTIKSFLNGHRRIKVAHRLLTSGQAWLLERVL
jgi:hypothetical protein